MILSRAAYLCFLLAFASVACEDKNEPAPAKPSSPAVAPASAPARLAPTVSAAASSAEKAPKSKPPKQLADGMGYGKLLELHEGFLYWTTLAGAGCPTPGDCPSASDARILRVPKDGGMTQEVAGGLDNVSSLSFDEKNVYWSMCGLVDYVQRCRITSMPSEGGKRNLVFDSGPDLITNVVWTGDHVVWSEPGKNRLQKSDGQANPVAFAKTGDVTRALAQDGILFWTEGRALAPEGRVMKATANGSTSTVATERRFPRHLATDGQSLFWVETLESEAGRSTQVVFRIDLKGGEPKPLIQDLAYVDGITVAGDRLVLVTTDSVAWVSKSGGDLVVMAAQQKSPHGPAADETYAYWISDNKVWRAEFSP